jgi:hypothetical protein
MTQLRKWRGLGAVAMLCGAVALASAGLMARAADTAKIEGVLKEASGAVLAQANVTLKPPTGADKRVAADAKGGFAFSGLAAGTYSVTIDSPGFQSTRYTNLVLKEGQTRQFDFSLRPGAVSTPIEIDIARPLSQSEIDRLFVPAPGAAPVPGVPGTHGVIAGRLLNGAGAPAQAVRVGVVAADSGIYGVPRVMAFDTRTDGMGFYRLTLPAGRYFVVAGSETSAPDASYIDRPVYFPGVPDASRALSIVVGPGSYDTVDFRLDSPVILPPPPVTYYYGPYRVSGQVVFAPRYVIPQPYPPYPLIYPYPYPDPFPGDLQVILNLGGTSPRGCVPGRAAYSSGVAWDGQFDFRSVSRGAYEVCVVRTGPIPRGAASGAYPRTVLYGPSVLIVDRDIVGLRLDIGAVTIYR